MSLDHRHLKNLRSLVAGRELFESEDDKIQLGTGYNFLTGIVQDVISNPYEYLNREYADTGFKLKDVLSGRIQSAEIGSDNTNKKGTTQNLALVNPQVVETMPINSIFAYIIDDNQSKDDPKMTVCYPFFPPHLSLPLKSGEYVWIICENIKGVKYYYWMCRKVASLQVDDINYTNMERIPAVNDILQSQATQGGNSGIDYEGAYSLDEVEDGPFNQKNKKTNMPISLSDIMRTSYSYNQEFTGEPVPRLAKHCGDIVLQGSNNGGLHITTEKFDDLSENTDAEDFYVGTGAVEAVPPVFRKPVSPAIDLFVGRKINSLNLLKNQTTSTNIDSKINVTSNNSKNSFYRYVENDKMVDSKNSDLSVYSKELNDTADDATDVAARLYMSNKCSVDLNFGSQFDILSSHYGPSIVTYAHHNRMIGASDVRLASQSGQSFIDMDPAGNIVAKASIDDGQQFLSLGANGITRLNAKSSGEIHLAVRNDDDRPPEPYILHSELAPILKKLGGDAAFLNQIINILLEALSKVPPVAAVLTPLLESVKALREAREANPSGSGTLTYDEPVVETQDDGTEKITGHVPKSIPISLEIAGDNVNS